jgi:hypothetical protein
MVIIVYCVLWWTNNEWMNEWMLIQYIVYLIVFYHDKL